MDRNYKGSQLKRIQHVFIIGSKSIGQYGGYETFVDRLIAEHENEDTIKYHIACKANGDGCMDESKLDGVTVIKTDIDGNVQEFEYKNAHIYKIKCPNIGPAVAIYYDKTAMNYSIRYCKKNHIEKPFFYILTCRIGLFIKSFTKKIKALDGIYYLNPDGHEWKRTKWSAPVRKYWKWSEKQMVDLADLIVCDSMSIERYIKAEYKHPNTCFIAYGADVNESALSDNDSVFLEWLKNNMLTIGRYYLAVGRFVPENNYETMIREFMRSKSEKDFALITNTNEKYLSELEEKLHWKSDSRIKFVGTVYNKELLKKIRENAYAYFHGHEVGGTNPSLLEALGSTKLNLLLDVNFNKEVGQEAALYWNKDMGNLSSLIDTVDDMSDVDYCKYGLASKERIRRAYNWHLIGEKYKALWIQ